MFEYEILSTFLKTLISYFLLCVQCYGDRFEFEFMFPFGFGSDLSLRALVVVIIL